MIKGSQSVSEKIFYEDLTDFVEEKNILHIKKDTKRLIKQILEKNDPCEDKTVK